MSGIVWLASYPKSGNTWFRMLMASLHASDKSEADINNISTLGGINALSGLGNIASARRPFDDLMLIDSGLLTHDEIDALRPRLYEKRVRGADEGLAAEAAPEARLLKVHDAYAPTPLGEPLLAGGHGAIVIVRDPRAVAPSLAHHNGITVDRAIEQMNNPAYAFGGSRIAQARQLRQRLMSWSGHVESWLDQRDIPVHLLRYEDMRSDPVASFLAATRFAGFQVAHEQAERAVRLADFDRFKAQEREHGFCEAQQGRVFFRRGEAEAWREELSTGQIARIEGAHRRVMGRLGYRCITANADGGPRDG